MLTILAGYGVSQSWWIFLPSGGAWLRCITGTYIVRMFYYRNSQRGVYKCFDGLTYTINIYTILMYELYRYYVNTDHLMYNVALYAVKTPYRSFKLLVLLTI